MVSKVLSSTLAFKVVKYLLDGIIDGEIEEKDFQSFKSSDKENAEIASEFLDGEIKCLVCDRVFKTRHGLSIHKSKIHEKDQKRVSRVMISEGICFSVGFLRTFRH